MLPYVKRLSRCDRTLSRPSAPQRGRALRCAVESVDAVFRLQRAGHGRVILRQRERPARLMTSAPPDPRSHWPVPVGMISILYGLAYGGLSVGQQWHSITGRDLVQVALSAWI